MFREVYTLTLLHPGEVPRVPTGQKVDLDDEYMDKTETSCPCQESTHDSSFSRPARSLMTIPTGLFRPFLTCTP